jgi:hypothetical protein
MAGPWTKGIHRDYTAFVMEVHVCRDRVGVIRSFRCLQDARDEEAASALPGSGGMEEGAWALLTECARAETLLQVLVKLSNDVEFHKKIVQGTEIDSELIENFTKATLDQIRRGLDEVLPSVVREIITTVRDGLKPQDE